MKHPPPTGRRRLRRAGAALLGLALFLLPGCSGPQKSVDPLADLRAENLSETYRLAAVDQAWEQMLAGTLPRPAVRDEFKKDLFLLSTGNAVRLRIVEKLVSDPTEEGLADTRAVLRLRLPTEPAWPIVEYVCHQSAERGWTDMTPALVRSYARQVKGTPDEKRPEREALLRLHPGESIEEIVYNVFINQATAPLPEGAKPADPKLAAAAPGHEPLPLGTARSGRSFLEEKIQTDAWALLTRLDKDGSRRAALLAADPRVTGTGPQDPMLADLRAAARDLRAVPITAPELEWVRVLRTPGNANNAAWWAAATAALARLDAEQASGLEVRHAEPVRWARLNHPAWLTMSRAQLRAELATRLHVRRTYTRVAERNDVTHTPNETLDDWDAKLVWADLLTMLVIDESLQDARVRRAIWEQVQGDQANRQTEYGGAIEAVWPENDPARADPSQWHDGSFEARLYLPPIPPRPVPQETGDSRFVASEQMIASTPRCLAHYHFHVQDSHNSRYAGPSRGDLDYAASYTRNCLVFTSIEDGLLDVDFYQRNGACIDLGEIRR